MSPLALDIYAILRTRLRSAQPLLTSSALVGKLSTPFNLLDPKSPILMSALGELALACRASGLPAITVMVVVAPDLEEKREGGVELTMVCSSRYPPAL